MTLQLTGGHTTFLRIPGLRTTGIVGNLTLTKSGSTAQTATFPDASIEVQATAEVISGNWTARNHATYNVIASATATDPGTPAAGHEFTTLVRNGTLTTSRGTYSVAGTLVQSVWHSGSWTDYPYGPLNGANTWTAAQTLNLSGVAPVGGTGHLTLIGPSAANATIATNSYAGAGLFVNYRTNGTPASPTGVVANDNLTFIGGAGRNSDGTYTGSTGIIALYATETFIPATNRGTAIRFEGTVTGSGTRSTFGTWLDGNLGIAATPTAGNGLLQLASGATRANGIWMGDFPVFRAATGVLAIGDGTTAASTATTVGAAGGASALPATPTGYIRIAISGTIQKIPFYADV